MVEVHVDNRGEIFDALKWLVQANQQANMYVSHVCNAVTLEWGLLRLAPSNMYCIIMVQAL